jgi:hypothetical protein
VWKFPPRQFPKNCISYLRLNVLTAGKTAVRTEHYQNGRQLKNMELICDRNRCCLTMSQLNRLSESHGKYIIRQFSTRYSLERVYATTTELIRQFS